MRRGFSTILVMCLAAAGCSSNMTDQPSYQPQEPPRLQSPSGSVPRPSRALPEDPPPRTDDRLQRGARLFRVNCAHCHGQTGEGDGPVAPYLSYPPVNLHASHVQAKPEPALYAILTDGLDVMPAFRGILSAEERWAVVYLVKSMAANARTATQGATPEAVDQGKLLFITYCQACHGPRGRGDGPLAATMNPKPGETASAIFQTISEGVRGSPMPAFGHLAEKDRRALTGYVLSLRTRGDSPK